MNISKDLTSGPKTFVRGLRVLEALRQAGEGGLKITDIAAATGIQRTTVYRYLDVLLDEDYAVASEDGRRFRFNASRSAGSALDIFEQTIARLKPVLRNISAQAGDSSFLVCRENGDSHCVHREVGSYPLQVLAVTIGHRQPLGVGAAGLALLANLPEADIEQVLVVNQEILPRFGGMSTAKMRRLIASTLERGWSAVGNAAVPGVVGVGLPVPRRGGHPLFGVSVSSVVERMNLQRQRYIVNLIQRELAASGLEND
ncbi:winged helix-turn-helix transcriptional regulator [Allopusillimonas soli]|uniref:Helix-turn-helix domain-containing protein n=1 Tax=Allopusillimonas soli TaxID=659016 RepID=A0A853FK46_9BURK|nr:helix-turn-helix domain-containing protein [Allopusillimonas soli]NYT38741.1 helix-turn-helix domain-containing protein [Allopusillimonas soli]TEA70275.1 winged helix-turn-helix transcriptional regulator [Allopusillimonas soli]